MLYAATDAGLLASGWDDHRDPEQLPSRQVNMTVAPTPAGL